MASAAVLSATSFVRVLLTPGATTVATLAVSIAMGATVIGAVMFGTIAPIVLDGMGVSESVEGGGPFRQYVFWGIFCVFCFDSFSRPDLCPVLCFKML